MIDPMVRRRVTRDDRDMSTLTRRQMLALLGLPAALATRSAAAAELPIFDAHVHYSHDAVELVPPKQAVQILRSAGLKGAFVSSSDDDGTQLLLAEAPDLIVPELRPYRTRADTGTWTSLPEVARYVEERLAQHRYVGLGESIDDLVPFDPALFAEGLLG